MNWKYLIYIWFIVSFSIFLTCKPLLAQEYSIESLKSALIYNFGKNITWENEEDISSFTISVYGDDQLILNELKKIANSKTLKNKPLKISQFKQIDEIKPIQILYVAKNENENLFKILEKISGNHTLLITDEYENLEFTMINFILQEGNIRFKINNQNIINENLTILPKTLLLGGTFVDVAELYEKSEKLLQDEKKKVEQQQFEISQQKKEIQKQLLEIETQNNKINTQQIQITTQQTEIDNQKEELNNLLIDIEKKQEELRGKLILIIKREKEIKIQQLAISDQQKILDSQNSDIEEQQNQILTQKKILSEQFEKIKTQKLFLILFIILIIMFVFLVFFIFRGYKIKQSKNSELRKKNEAINQQKEEILKQSEELIAQSDVLSKTNSELENQKNKLEETLQNLKNTQSKLIQSEKMASIGTLTAGIAHEINNPINYINSGVNSLQLIITDILSIISKYEEITPKNVEIILNEIEILKNELEYNELTIGINELTTNIKNGISRTIDIIKGLSTYSRLDETISKTIDIHENIDATLIMLRNQTNGKIKLIKDYNLTQKVECISGKINQILMNLLVNAIQSIPKEGTITIVTLLVRENETDYACIKIKDTGMGMPREIKEKIYEPFFTTKDVGKGTGLGLSICFNIIKSHSGKIEVESEHKKGTEFIIYLPIKYNIINS